MLCSRLTLLCFENLMNPDCVFHAFSQEHGQDWMGDVKSLGHDMPVMRDGPQLDAAQFVS